MDYNWLLAPSLLTLKVLAWASILNLTLGLALAFAIAYMRSRALKTVLETLVALPLIFPPMATGFLLLYVLGRQGFLGRALGEEWAFVFEFRGLVLAAFVSGLPLLVKPIQSALESFPNGLVEAGQICAKSNLNIALFVILPNIKNTLVASFFIASARAVGEVGISLILGGNIIGKTDTISLAIYNAVFDGENEKALVLSLVLIVVSLFFFVLTRAFSRKRAV